MPVISTNTAANSAVRYLNINSQQMSSSLSKLSSGSKITQASDDAAGLAISTRISSDVTTLQQAATNASQATSILQTADGGASNISDILARMKSLASQSSSGTVTDSSRAYLNSEFTALSDQIDSIATGTRYSGQSLLDGTSDRSRRHGPGRPSSADTITVTLDDLTAALGVDTPDISTRPVHRGNRCSTSPRHRIGGTCSIGAQESRFNFSASSISTQSQNLQAANSAILDVDIAAEQAKLSSAQVKVQAAVAAESSANQMPQYLLKLL
jgi:flagellin